MKLRNFILGLLIVVMAFFGFKYVIKEYIFPFKHKELIETYSKENNLDPYLVLSVIKAESKFDANAKSHKNAHGLMQITEETGAWVAEQMNLTDFSVEKLYDEEYNIKLGCWYLNNLREEFNDMDLVLASYNAGRGRVNEWLKNPEYSKDNKTLSIIPYKETAEYVNKVDVYYNFYKKIYKNNDK